MTRPSPAPSLAFDPWAHVATHWPDVTVVLEPMGGLLLGRLCYPVIALRAGSSAAQHRSTPTHEIVHLERGVLDCGPWTSREEALVEAEAARRLVTPEALVRALHELGARPGVGAVARSLDVDSQTVRVRLARLTEAESASIAAAMGDELWTVA